MTANMEKLNSQHTGRANDAAQMLLEALQTTVAKLETLNETASIEEVLRITDRVAYLTNDYNEKVKALYRKQEALNELSKLNAKNS